MFAVMNPPGRKRRKKKLRKGCRRVAVRSCRKTKRSKGKTSHYRYKGCKGLSPEACLADYELSGRAAPRGLIKKVSAYAKRQAAAAKGRATKARRRADECAIGETYGWFGKKKPKYCGAGSDRLVTAAERGYFSVNPRRGRAMKRRKGKKRGSRGFGFFKMNPATITGALPTLKPDGIKSSVPQIAGLMAGAFLTTKLAGLIPYTRTGIGNYFLGAVAATLLGKLAGHFGGASLGRDVTNGGYLGVGARLVGDVSTKGISALTNLSGYDSDVMNDMALYGYDDDVLGTGAQLNLGDFVTPPQTGAAFSMQSSAGQYPLPQSVPIPPELQWTPGGNQNWRPGGNQKWSGGGTPFNPGGNQMWAPGGSPFNPNAIPPAPVAPPGSAAATAEMVANAAQSGAGMNDYESNILGSVLGEQDSAFDEMSGF